MWTGSRLSTNAARVSLGKALTTQLLLQQWLNGNLSRVEASDASKLCWVKGQSKEPQTVNSKSEHNMATKRSCTSPALHFSCSFVRVVTVEVFGLGSLWKSDSDWPCARSQRFQSPGLLWWSCTQKHFAHQSRKAGSLHPHPHRSLPWFVLC